MVRAEYLHFYRVLGLWESNQGPKEKEKTAFYFHFYKVFCILGAKVKGERVKGFWGNWVLGTRVLGLWAIIKRGELGCFKGSFRSIYTACVGIWAV